MTVRDFCAPDQLASEWSENYVEDREVTSAQWIPDKSRKRIVEFIFEGSTPSCVDEGVDLEIAFLGHATKWEQDTRRISSMSDILRHPSYQWIIMSGRENPRQIISLLLRDMRDHNRPWFTALTMIANTNPADPKDAGRVDKMKKAWLKWGSEEGLL